MGITGLIPFLEKACRKVHMRELQGSTVAIDTYCWLHKGVFGCAEKILRGEKTDFYVQYCLKQLDLLIAYDVKPILVFDGRNLPAKEGVEQDRRKSRKEAKEKVKELVAQGRTGEARQQMQRAIDVSHDMALELIKECRKRNIDCIVSPYEADGQLAYLNLTNIAQYVITEDSDLVLFGCKKILFKFCATGGLLFESDKLHLTVGCHPDKFEFTTFRRMCILSGCDYLKSLNGIGLAKAKKFFSLTTETDMRRALTKVPSYLNMRQLTITDEYKEAFLRAEATFKHMIVYNPLQRCLTRLTPVDENIDESLLVNAGEFFDENTAFHLALGNINPRSMKKLDEWTPERSKITANPKYKTSSHASIWKGKFQTPSPAQPSKKPRTKVDTTTASTSFIHKIASNYNKKKDEMEIARLEESIIDSYLEDKSPEPSPKIKRQKLETPPSDKKSSKNPFKAFSPSTSRSIVITEKSSLLTGLGETSNEEKENKITSNLFTTNRIQNDENSAQKSLEELRKKLLERQKKENLAPKPVEIKNIYSCDDDKETESQGQEHDTHENCFTEPESSTAMINDNETNCSAITIVEDKEEKLPDSQKKDTDSSQKSDLNSSQTTINSSSGGSQLSLSDSMITRLEPNVIIEESDQPIVILDHNEPDNPQPNQKTAASNSLKSKSSWKTKNTARVSGLSRKFTKPQLTLTAFGFTSLKK